MPKVVGETPARDLIFEVRSVRMVLLRDAAHFTRLVVCSKCGRDVPGPPVLSPADLDHSPNPAICKDCVRSATGPPATARAATAPPAAVSQQPAPSVAAPAVARREPAPADDRVAALERQLAELTRLLHAQRSELDTALRLRTGENRAELTTLATDTQALAQSQEDLGRTQEDLGRRFDHVVERLERLQVGAGSDADRAQAASAAAAAQGRELQAGFRDGLAEVQSTIATHGAESARRLEALEQQVREADGEMSELGELHAALDVGMGTLRSEIAELRSAVRGVAGVQSDVQDELETLARVPRAGSTDDGRGRKVGRKSEAGQMPPVLAAVENLAQEHQQVKAQLAVLAQAVEAATAAAARASSQASASGPLRSDVRSLQEQLAAQNDALVALSTSVERLRRKVPGPAPAAKRAPRTTKDKS